MEEKAFLPTFYDAIKKAFSAGPSFQNVSSLIKAGKLKMAIPYDYERTIKKAATLKDVLEKISFIVYKPKLKTISAETVSRSEVGGRLDPSSFQKTMRDSSVWRRKDGGMAPEYVYHNENEDTIVSYENLFVCLLINLVCHDVADLYDELIPVVACFEEKEENKGISFGKESPFQDLPPFAYPYKDRFKPEESAPSRAVKALGKLNKMVKNIKASEFYRLLSSEKGINGEITLTNILLHDEVYNALYRFYVGHYLERSKGLESLSNSQYYDYALVSLFYGLSLSEPSLAKKINCHLDEKDSRLRFEPFSLKKGLLAFSFKEDPSSLSLQIEADAIIKDAGDPSKTKAHYSLLMSKDYDEVNGPLLEKALFSEEESSSGAVLISMNNLSRRFDHVLKITYYDEDNQARVQNLLSSWGMLFSCEGGLFKELCPVCGGRGVFSEGSDYICPSCGSRYVILGEKSQYLWIKSFRRPSHD